MAKRPKRVIRPLTTEEEVRALTLVRDRLLGECESSVQTADQMELRHMAAGIEPPATVQVLYRSASIFMSLARQVPLPAAPAPAPAAHEVTP